MNGDSRDPAPRERQPVRAAPRDDADRREHRSDVVPAQARQVTQELARVVVDPRIDPRKALTRRSLSKPGENPAAWEAGPVVGAAPRTVGGATMQVPLPGARRRANGDVTGGIAEALAAKRLTDRKTRKLETHDDTAPLPGVVAGPPPIDGSAPPPPAGAARGIDVPPPSREQPNERLLAEITPAPPRSIAAVTEPSSPDPTPRGLGPVVVSPPRDPEDDKITQPVRASAVQALEEAKTVRVDIAEAPRAPDRRLAIAAVVAVLVAVLGGLVWLGRGSPEAEPSGGESAPTDARRPDAPIERAAGPSLADSDPEARAPEVGAPEARAPEAGPVGAAEAPDPRRATDDPKPKSPKTTGGGGAGRGAGAKPAAPGASSKGRLF
jgi:hypothetical protein